MEELDFDFDVCFSRVGVVFWSLDSINHEDGGIFHFPFNASYGTGLVQSVSRNKNLNASLRILNINIEYLISI